MTPSLILIMQALYANEINCSVSCVWDGGWEVKLGDEMNGWKAEANFDNDKLDDAAQWLRDEVKKVYPRTPCFRKFGR